MTVSTRSTVIRILLVASIVFGTGIIALSGYVLNPFLQTVETKAHEEDKIVLPAHDYQAWADWAVQAEGRTKPFETHARETVRSITGRSKFQGQDSIGVVLMWMFANGMPVDGKLVDWESYPFILADHHGLRKWIYADRGRTPGEAKLTDSGITEDLLVKLDTVLSEEQKHGKYVSPKDIRDSVGFRRLLREAATIRREDPDKGQHLLSPEQRKAEEVQNRLRLYDVISQTPVVGSLRWEEMWVNDPLGVVQLDEVLGSEWVSIGKIRLLLADAERWRVTLGTRMMQHPKKYIDPAKQQELVRFQSLLSEKKGMSAVDEAVEQRTKDAASGNQMPLKGEEIETLRKQVRAAESEGYHPDDPKYLMLHLNYMEMRYPQIYFDALTRQGFPEAESREVLNAYQTLQRAYLVSSGVELGSPELGILVGGIGAPSVMPTPKFDEASQTFFATVKRVSDQMAAEGVADLADPELKPAIAAYRSAMAEATTPEERQAARDSLFVSAKEVGVDPHRYPGTDTISLELSFNKMSPFMWAWIIMAPACAAFLISVVSGSTLMYRTGFALYLFSLAFQVFGFYCRIMVSGRPPVSNMYETIIFVAFMSGVFAMILEFFYPKRVIALAGSLVALMALVLADQLPLMFDQEIKPLVPVLRSNFWLIIHVLTIVASYAGGTLAWGLANVTLAWMVFGKPDSTSLKTLSQFTYRAMQIAVLLLAAGTFLGGWWAAYSWGRFWGWDPKETWALISLVCYVIPLHARYIGWVKDFGLAVSAVVCYAAILMCWYGVNFVLGAGLHSYGFGGGGPYFVLLAGLLNIQWVMVASMLYLRKLNRIEENKHMPSSDLEAPLTTV